MKTFYKYILIILLVLFSNSSAATEDRSNFIYQGDNYIGMCAEIGGGYYITAKHVVFTEKGKLEKNLKINNRSIEVISYGNQSYKDYDDWAIVKSKAKHTNTISFLSSFEKEKLYFHNQFGEIAYIELYDSDEGEYSFIGSILPVPGDSGSGVWSDHGDLVGIITANGTICENGSCRQVGYFVAITPKIIETLNDYIKKCNDNS